MRNCWMPCVVRRVALSFNVFVNHRFTHVFRDAVFRGEIR